MELYASSILKSASSAYGLNVDGLKQGSPNHSPRAKSGPQSHFIRPARPFINNGRKIFLQ